MASDQSIGITLTANSTGVEQALGKLATGLDRTIDKLNKLEKASKGATKATEDGLASGAAQALKFVGAITGIGGAIGGMLAIVNQIKREYDNMVSRQKEAAGAQIGFEQQLAQTVRNAGGVLSGEQVKEMSLKLADSAGVDPTKAVEVLGSAFSARGINNAKQAEQVREATEATLKFAPELSAQDAAMTAGTVIDLQKRTGMTPRQALGLLQLTSGAARTTTLKGVAENVLPGAMSMEQIGGMSMEKNAALMSALTQGIVDPEGAVSRTAGIVFARELRERLPKLPDTEARLQAINADPKLQKAFLEGGRFNGKEFPAAEIGRGQATASVEQLIRGKGTAFDAFQENVQTLGDRAAAGQAFDNMMREIGKVTFTGRVQRTFQGATQQQQILDQEGGITSVNREGLQAFLKSVGQSDLSQRVDSLLFEGRAATGGAATDIAAKKLRAEAKSLRSPAQVYTGDELVPTTNFEPTQRDLNTAKAMESLATQLEGLSKEIKANTKATSENTKVSPSPVQRPSRVPSAALSRRN